MNLNKYILTQNDCYKVGKKITVKGIMVHSTGANNPWLKRYIPDDRKIGKNQYGNHWNPACPRGVQVCVHGFIGKLADGTIATYQPCRGITEVGTQVEMQIVHILALRFVMMD